jgi:hypothetical protein
MNGNSFMSAFAHLPHLLLVAMLLCSGEVPVYGRDPLDVRFAHQTHSVNTPIAELHSDCPPPLTVLTFLHQQICVHACLGEKLAAANTILEKQGFTQASQLGVQRLTGFRPGQSSLHGQGMAIDIDAATNPYIIHERHEFKLDEALGVVYERIAQFILGRTSMIPHLGTSGQGKETRHAYVTRLYSALAQESVAMQRYFMLMQDGRRLREYVQTPPGS